MLITTNGLLERLSSACVSAASDLCMHMNEVKYEFAVHSDFGTISDILPFLLRLHLFVLYKTKRCNLSKKGKISGIVPNYDYIFLF